MSGPDDTTPPTEANDTEPPPPMVIARGQAQIAVSRALDELSRAFMLVEATAMACARQVDATTEGP